jgi:cytochrome c biogenesis protein CcmG/thiol:disulfide interchange protein DsbE
VLPAGASGAQGLKAADFRDGKPRLLNIFASWCVPCAAEAAQLQQLHQRGAIIEGVAVRDAQADVDLFLSRYGNPYGRIALDARSALQFNLGSSGVPETYVIDGKGIIRYQHIGAINATDVDTILAKLQEAGA